MLIKHKYMSTWEEAKSVTHVSAMEDIGAVSQWHVVYKGGNGTERSLPIAGEEEARKGADELAKYINDKISVVSE